MAARIQIFDFDRQGWSKMDEKLFQRQLESCRTQKEDVSWLEIFNYTVQMTFPRCNLELKHVRLLC